MNLTEFIFILAISLQVTGSCLLLLHLLSLKRKDVIYRFMGRSLVVSNEEKNNTEDLDIVNKEFIDFYKSSYLNVFVFVYLFLGYLCNFYSEYKLNNFKWWFLFIFLILVILLAFIAYSISKKLADNRELITHDELRKLGIKPHIETTPRKDIEKLFEEDKPEK